MSKLEMSLRNLTELDFGKINLIFDAQMKTVIRDCMDRPVDKKPRSVTLEIRCVPQSDDRGDCLSVIMDALIGCKMPKHRTRAYQCEARTTGHLLFNPDTPEDVNQMSLDEKPETTQHDQDQGDE